MVVHAKSKKEMREEETETHRDRDRTREKHAESQRPLLHSGNAFASQASFTELQIHAEERLGLPWSPSGFSLPVGFILS